MKGKDLKNKTYEIELKDGTHKVIFDMNAFCELEELYGDIKIALESFKTRPISALRSFVYVILKNEGREVKLQEAGSLIDMSKIEPIVEVIGKAIEEAMPNTENIEVDEEDESNQVSPNV